MSMETDLQLIVLKRHERELCMSTKPVAMSTVFFKELQQYKAET